MHHNLCPKVETSDGILRTVALYSKNREEWVVTDFGCFMTNITVVTLYDTLGKDSIEYILDQAHIKTLVLSADKIPTILGLKKEGKVPKLTHIIYFDETKAGDQADAAKFGVTLINFNDVLSEGTNLSVELEKVTAESLFTICYTSGTTGMPKGVMLTQRAFISNIGAIERFDGIFRFRNDDVYLSYLPLAHVMERLFLLESMAFQVQIGFFGGDVLKLKEDLIVLRPTVFVSVPRLFNRFYDAIQ